MLNLHLHRALMLVVVVVATVSSSEVRGQAVPEELFYYLAAEGGPRAGGGRAPSGVAARAARGAGDAVRSHMVGVALQQLGRARAVVAAGETATVTLNLFADSVFTATLDRINQTERGYTLSGTLAGSPFSSVVLVVNGDIVAGSVRAPATSATYALAPVTPGVIEIRKTEPWMPHEGDDFVLASPAGSGSMASNLSGAPVGYALPADAVTDDLQDGSVIDLLMLYTSAAREWFCPQDQDGRCPEGEDGRVQIEAEIDAAVAGVNRMFEDSGVIHRINLVGATEVDYVETPSPAGCAVAHRHLADLDDGHLDEVNAIRDRYAADLVSLVIDNSPWRIRGSASQSGPFSAIAHGVLAEDTTTFAHELGHNLSLGHDRYQETIRGTVVVPDLSHYPIPYAFGYVNQRAFDPGAPESAHWKTIMAYPTQCDDFGIECVYVPRFSNPDLTFSLSPDGPAHPMGVPGDEPSASIDGPADAVRVINATGPTVARWSDRPRATAEALPDLALTLPGMLGVDVSRAFFGPDSGALTYAAWSSAPGVAAVSAAGARLTLTAVSVGTATIQVTATDPGGLSAMQSFTVTVTAAAAGARFTDDPLRPGVTPVRAIHLMELRARIAALREAAGLGRYRWTDPVLRVGTTRVRLVHLTELRSALEAAYTAAGRSVPRWTNPAPVAGMTPIRAMHLTELRSAVVALE